MHRTFMALLLAAVTISASAGTWYEQYENGVRAIEQGRAEEAKAALAAAIAARGEEGLQVPARPQQYLDYLPHLYLAIAHQMSGDVDHARKELALAETSGAAAKSEVGRPLLVAYELLLRGDATSPRPRYAVYEPKSPLLSEREFQTLRDDVLEVRPAARHEAERGTVVRELRARPRARAQGRLPARAHALHRRRRPPSEPAEAGAHVRHVAHRLLPILSHRALARAPRELAMRQERPRDLPAPRRDPAERAGAQRIVVAPARDGTETGGAAVATPSAARWASAAAVARRDPHSPLHPPPAGGARRCSRPA